jgi:hypothetical protein
LAHNGLILLEEHARDQDRYEATLLPEAYLHYGAIKQPTLPEVYAAVRAAVEGT